MGRKRASRRSSSSSSPRRPSRSTSRPARRTSRSAAKPTRRATRSTSKPTRRTTSSSAKPTRRIDLVFGCGYGDDLRAVKKYLKDVLDDDPRVLQDPEPDVAVDDLSDNSVNFVVRPWVKAEDYWAVRWDLTERIKLGFDERGFSIPYPSRDVYTHAS